MRVAVIGAGIVGGAIAFYLARRGVDVTLIDAGEPGMGPQATRSRGSTASERSRGATAV